MGTPPSDDGAGPSDEVCEGVSEPPEGWADWEAEGPSETERSSETEDEGWGPSEPEGGGLEAEGEGEAVGWAEGSDPEGV